MLGHWVKCEHTKFEVCTVQLTKADKKTPVTNKCIVEDIKAAIPDLYRKLCQEVHSFGSMGGLEERVVVIPKVVGNFSEVDRVAFANLVQSFEWPFKVGEDYDVK